MEKPLVSVTLHDREELVGPCLESLKAAGEEFDLAICADGCDFDPGFYAKQADIYVEHKQAEGPAAARNALLRFRRPGQDVLFLDSDIVFTTSGWLKRLRDTLYSQPHYGAVSPAMLPKGLRPFHGILPNTGIHDTNNLPVGARLAKGQAMDELGALRVYGSYGCEDLDFDCRTQALGYQLVYDSDVVVEHPGIPADDAWKRQMLEDCLPRFKQWEQAYADKRHLYIPLNRPQIPFPSMLSTMTEKEYGSHLPVLRWALENTTGPILELGGGLYSTPLLHNSGRPVVTVERHPKWKKYLANWASPTHQVVEEIPAGSFGLVFVDNEEDRRVPDLLSLKGRFDIAICHDTEPSAWAADIVHWEDALGQFPHRFDYKPDGVPWTTVVSEKVLPRFKEEK